MIDYFDQKIHLILGFSNVDTIRCVSLWDYNLTMSLSRNRESTHADVNPPRPWRIEPAAIVCQQMVPASTPCLYVVPTLGRSSRMMLLSVGSASQVVACYGRVHNMRQECVGWWQRGASSWNTQYVVVCAIIPLTSKC